MVTAVSSVVDYGQSAQSFGSTAHRQLQELIDNQTGSLNEYLEQFNAKVIAEVFRDKNGDKAKIREKGSIGLDVVVLNTITNEAIFAFDLKTGKTGTSKSKAGEFGKRFNGAPIIDVYVRRK
ncbi:hypothetical protein ISG33_11065 [Glaciecola sp. MH2013]|uniref:hypothetical protein n=1 Tax=Glaciecola sp. MH2013 TaxID=2785524 RepID=UPI00189F1834|nr:hypothetical protein [Glaciecola sp. MH2013]MBF7073940.1 hypothetical protein [Glaciecola sp. MH2013]